MFVFLINSNQHYIHSSYVYGAPVEWCSVLVPLAAAPTCCAAVVARVRPTLPPCAFSRSHGRPSRPSRRIRSPASGPLAFRSSAARFFIGSLIVAFSAFSPAAAMAFSVPALADEAASSTLALIADMLVMTSWVDFGPWNSISLCGETLQLKRDDLSIYKYKSSVVSAAAGRFPSVDTHGSSAPFKLRMWHR